MPLTRFKMYQLRLELTSLSSHILDCQSEQLSVYLAVTIVCYISRITKYEQNMRSISCWTSMGAQLSRDSMWKLPFGLDDSERRVPQIRAGGSPGCLQGSLLGLDGVHEVTHPILSCP
jgi:hypothetical protein